MRVVSAATGHEAATLASMLDAPEVTAAYDRDRAEARSAAGSAAEKQGKTAQTDGQVRYTAPSVLFTGDGVTLTAGGFQKVEAYDVLVANLDPAIERREVPEDPAELLAAFPLGLTTQEVTALLTRSNDAPDPVAAEVAMLDLVAEGRAERVALGDSAVWAGPGQLDWMPSACSRPRPTPAGWSLPHERAGARATAGRGLVRSGVPLVLHRQAPLDLALEQFEHRDSVDVTWRSFELSPQRAVRAPLSGRPPRHGVGAWTRPRSLQRHERVTSDRGRRRARLPARSRLRSATRSTGIA